jgi:hypothetical protein
VQDSNGEANLAITIVIDKDVETCPLKNHNQIILPQMKKLKNEKKTQKEKLEQFASKEAMTSEETMPKPIEIEKSSNVKIPIVDKKINTDLVNLTTQNDANPTNVKMSSHVEVETS